MELIFKKVFLLLFISFFANHAHARVVEMECHGEEPMFNISINSFSEKYALNVKLPTENESASFRVLNWNKSYFSNTLKPSLSRTAGDLNVSDLVIQRAGDNECQEIGMNEQKFKVALMLNGYLINGCCSGWSRLFIQSSE